MIGDIPAYPQDTGTYTLLLNVGYDYTGYSTLAARVKDPSGNFEDVSEGAELSAYSETDHLVALSITTARTDELGRWRAGAVIDGKESEPFASYDVVEEAVNG